MKKIILTLVLFSFFFFGKTTNSVLYAQWMAQTPPTGTTSLNSVYAISPTSVACAGAQRVIRTLDGGLTWTSPLTLGGVNIYSIHSGYSANWLALTQNTTWMMTVGNPGGITLSSGHPDSIMALHFSTPGCITAVGTTGKIETSCDTGATWQVRVFTGLTLNSVWYADANTGVACGVFGSIKRTVDGGTTWATVTSGVVQNLNGITFADVLTGYIVGNSGTFLKTIDGGATWTSMPLLIPNSLNGVYFVSADTGYVVGSGGLIRKTVDGGTSWTTMTSNTTQILRSVHFANHTAGWVCGDGGVILKYCPTLSVTGNITGATTVCAGDTLTYSIPAVTGAIGYSWTFPLGWVGGGSGSTISVIAGYGSGNVSVAATNSCGNGTPVTLAVTVNSPPVPVITQNFNVLTSSATTNNQWYLNGTAVAGATGQTYNFTSNGTYTVIVTSNGCSSESSPLVITNAGVNEQTDDAAVFIYPNPSTGQFQISNLKFQIKSLKITDVVGHVVFQSTIAGQQTTIELTGVAKGIYFLQLVNENKNEVMRKIIVE